MRKYLLPIIGVLLLGLSCEKKEQEVPVSSVSMSQATAEMVVGETISLSATVLPSTATDKTVNWTSSNQSVATVSGGKVTAVSEGQSTITASAGGKSATCKVTVSKGIIVVSSISLNKTDLALVEGDSETLVATVKPDDATDKTVTWSTSDASIATVENGKVTAVKEGEATITAKAGEKEATCRVTVAKKVIPVSSVELNKASLALTEGDSETLVATVKPDDATDKTVTWTTSNASVATVTNGVVTAIKEGEATITAAAGGKSVTCRVVVAKKVIAVESIELNKTTLELVEEDSETLVATVKPDNATDKTVTWTTSDASIATVENGKVTAVKEGEATITASAGSKSTTCKVVVAKKVIAVESIELNKTTLELVEDDSETLVATVKPDNATDKTVTWSTSDASVATVDGGKITAIKEGSAVIIAMSNGLSAKCSVTVKKKGSGIEDPKEGGNWEW